MNFRVKPGKQGHRGLWIGLLPGRYIGPESFDQTVRVHEDVFWFFETSIKRHSAMYARPYSHYAQTAVSRQEWEKILREWEDLVENLKTAIIPIELKILREIPRHVRRVFIHSFDRNRRKLGALAGRLVKWIRAELETQPEVSILGI